MENWIVGEIAAEENLILLLMELHLLFINLFSKRYATWQLNQLTQSLHIILVHERHPLMAEKTQDSRLGKRREAQWPCKCCFPRLSSWALWKG